MSQRAKFNACVQMAQRNSSCVFVCWFNGTREKLQQLFSEHNISNEVLLAEKIESPVHEAMVIFAEHYPLGSVEQIVFQKMNIKDVPVLSAMDEPIFQQFGGERLIKLMQNLGLGENEIIGHAMISRAIGRAQQKIGKRVKIEKKANDPEEWFRSNVV